MSNRFRLISPAIAIAGFCLMVSPLFGAKEGPYTYTESGGKATITAFDNNTEGVVNIPSTLGGYPVVALADWVFWEAKKITQVTVPEGVVTIGRYVFSNCKLLESVTLPVSLTSIGEGSFTSNPQLGTMTIPAAVNTIGDYAFADCAAMPAIQVAEGNDHFISIDGVLFNKDATTLIRCPGGKTGDYVVPEGVTSIGMAAFLACANLANVTIPDSVTSIGMRAFERCDGLTDVVIPDSVTTLELEAFYDCKGLKSATLPNGISELGARMFYLCTNLESIVVPDSVTTIDDGAFMSCHALTNVTLGTNLIHLGGAAFQDCQGLPAIALPDSVTVLGRFVFQSCTNLSVVTFGNGLDTIPDYAFDNCSALADVTLPQDLGYIGDYAFGYTRSLAGIDLPASIRDMSTGAFSGSGLTSVTVPETMTILRTQVFGYCNALTNVAFGTKLTQIGNQAFFNCGSLERIVLPDNITSIGSQAFYQCPKLMSVTLGKNFAGIGDNGFRKCPLLTELYFRGAPPDLGNTVFYDTPDVVFYVYANHQTAWQNALSFGSLDHDTGIWQDRPVRMLDYVPETYLVSYDVNGAIGGVPPADQTKVEDVELELAGSGDLEKTGYSFAGWNTAADGGGTNYAAFAVYEGNAALALYAQWTANVYTVTFDAQGGTVAPEGLEVVFGTEYGPLPVPLREGFTFAGWWSAPDGGILIGAGSTYTTAGATTLYARWTKDSGGTDDPYLAELAELDAAAIVAPLTTAYAGFIYDSSGTVQGTLTLKTKLALKLNRKTGEAATNWTFSAKALLQKAKLSFSGKDSGVFTGFEMSTRKGEVLAVTLAPDGFFGTLTGGALGSDTFDIIGSVNAFADKKDSAAQSRLGAVRGLYNVALLDSAELPAGYLTLNIGNGGKVKFAGLLADKSKVSGSATLLAGLNEDGWYAIALHKPLYSKRGFVGGLLWLSPQDGLMRVDSEFGWFVDWVSENPKAGQFERELDVVGGYWGGAGALAVPPAVFSALVPELPAPVVGLDGDWVEEAFPWLPITISGNKWALPKATKPKKVDGMFDYATENPATAKLSFTAKTGLFKGSFKLYFDGENAAGKLQHKALNVPYQGVMVPLEGGGHSGFGIGTTTINREKHGIPVLLSPSQ